MRTMVVDRTPASRIATIATRRFLPRWLCKKERNAAVPSGLRVYAVGDIHGRSDLLDMLMCLIRADAAGCRDQIVLVFLGDYVDRGADSKGVIERLLALPDSYQALFIRGNHDQVLLDFLDDPHTYDVGANSAGWRPC